MTLSKTEIIIIILILVLIVFLFYWHLKEKNPSGDKNSKGLGVKELISKVKSELVSAEQERINRGDAPLFELKEFDLEIKFVVSQEEKNHEDAKWQLVTVGTESSYSQEQIQTINLKMAVTPPKYETASPERDSNESGTFSQLPPPSKK
jgi:hypothetical protein